MRPAPPARTDMVLDRRFVARNVLPVGTLLLGAFLNAGVISAQSQPIAIRIAIGAVAIGVVFATVFAVLHHAEAIAHRIGEPYGTLVLTLAVTTIEVSVIVAMMLHGENNPTLARESSSPPA